MGGGSGSDWCVLYGGRGGVMAGFSLSFFFNDTATTEIYTLSLHDALPISSYENINIICRMYDIIFLIVNIIFFIISLSLTSFDEALNGKGDNYYFLCAKFVLGKHDKRRRGGGGGKHRMN